MKRNLNYETEYYNYSLQLYRRKIIILCCLEELLNQSAKKSPKRWYVRPIFLERPTYGQYNILQKEHQLCNSLLYVNYMRMDSTCFEELLSLVGPKLVRLSTRPDCLSIGEILSATVRYLASGQSMTDITYAFRVGLATASKFIFQCCSVLWEVLAPKMLPIPTQKDWENIALEFEQKWNFGNCIGAIDGKHCIHQAFPNSGSVNYNYKGSHSTVLLAVCDANCKFIMVDIGAPGRCSDGGVFKDSLIGKGLLNNTLQLPCPTKLSSSTDLFPYCLVGDEAFPLLPNLMRPYPGRGKSKLPLKQVIFNYRLSRARRTIENTFGLLAARWRIFRRPIIASEKTVHAIIQATVVLHNYVISNEKLKGTDNYCQSVHDNQLTTRQERRDNQSSGLLPVLQMGSNNPPKEGKDVREKFTNYFSGEGALDFQYDML